MVSVSDTRWYASIVLFIFFIAYCLTFQHLILRFGSHKAQTLRAAGGNAWRMAHNPPVPARLDILDRIGMLALDENHFFGGE